MEGDGADSSVAASEVESNINNQDTNSSYHQHIETTHKAGPSGFQNLSYHNLPSDIADQDSNSVYSEQSASTVTNTSKAWHSVKSKNITLDRLIRDGVLEPGNACLSVKYLGKTLVADLLEDGKIRSTETGDLFSTPSSWAIHCKRSINPAKTSGCGWSSIRYKGKSLDVYKSIWMNEVSDSSSLPISKFTIRSEETVKSTIKSEPLVHPSPPIEFQPLDPADSMFPCMSKLPLSEYDKHLSTQVRCEGVDISLKALFQQSACIQMAELYKTSTEEVSGYLSGGYDSLHNVVYVYTVYDKEDSNARQKIHESGQRLVGWFHSHPSSTYHPSVYDVECHLNYQLRLRDQPLIGCIVGRKDPDDASSLSLLCYTVSPPKLKFSERFGCLSDKCGKPKQVQWSLQTREDTTPKIPPSDPDVKIFLENITKTAVIAAS